MKTNSKILSLCFSPLVLAACQTRQPKKIVVDVQHLNILFICIDDLRTELGCYGFSEAKTPHLDSLASKGSLFFHQYASVPTSGASRASMFTGLYPRAICDISNDAAEYRFTYKKKGKNPETFIEALKRNGYSTIGIGKVSHSPDGYVYKYTSSRSNQLEFPHSWDEMLFDAGKWKTGWNAFFAYADGTNRNDLKNQVKPYECGDVSDEGYPDGLTANLAVSKLGMLAKKGKPFFLAVGFFKPHLPFNSPKKYWDEYSEDSISLTPMPNIPKNMNKASLHDSPEFNNGYRCGDENASLDHPVSDVYARKLRHAYLSCVSYTDAQVGKVMEALRREGLDKNTIVIVWGDHGWHLGDLRTWGKHTVMETALNSAFIMRVPGMKEGVKNKRIVSSIDIYPTLMDLCHIKTPYKLDGKSFVTLLNNSDDPAWKDVAYSYYNRGISVRTKDYRYTRYYRKAKPIEELYIYKQDRFERENIAAEHPEVVKKLLPIFNKANTDIYLKKK